MGAGIQVADADNKQVIDINEELTVDKDGKVTLSYEVRKDTSVHRK